MWIAFALGMFAGMVLHAIWIVNTRHCGDCVEVPIKYDGKVITKNELLKRLIDENHDLRERSHRDAVMLYILTKRTKELSGGGGFNSLSHRHPKHKKGGKK